MIEDRGGGKIIMRERGMIKVRVRMRMNNRIYMRIRERCKVQERVSIRMGGRGKDGCEREQERKRKG